MLRRIDRLFPLWTLLSFGLPPVVGALVTGPSQEL